VGTDFGTIGQGVIDARFSLNDRSKVSFRVKKAEDNLSSPERPKILHQVISEESYSTPQQQFTSKYMTVGHEPHRHSEGRTFRQDSEHKPLKGIADLEDQEEPEMPYPTPVTGKVSNMTLNSSNQSAERRQKSNKVVSQAFDDGRVSVIQTTLAKSAVSSFGHQRRRSAASSSFKQRLQEVSSSIKLWVEDLD